MTHHRLQDFKLQSFMKAKPLRHPAGWVFFGLPFFPDPTNSMTPPGSRSASSMSSPRVPSCSVISYSPLLADSRKASQEIE